MAGDEAEGVLVLLFGIHLVCRGELLYRRCIHAGAFFQLCSDDQPLTLKLRHLRLHIPLCTRGQSVGAHIAAIGAEHTGQRVPEGGFAVGTAAVGDDHLLDHHLADAGGPGNELGVFNQVLVSAKQQIELLGPQVRALIAGRDGGDFGHEVLRAMGHQPRHAFAEIIGASGGAKQIGVRVQLSRRDCQHGAGLLERVRDVLGTAAVEGECFILGCLAELRVRHGLLL